jgi:nitrite reductase/ring-hydroxylating ferredoxin subunit
MPTPLEKSVFLGRAEDWKAVQAFDRNALSVITLPVKRVPGLEDLLIAFTAAGYPRVISALCPHRKLPLELYARAGQIPGTIVCSAHRCVFDVATGICVNAHELSEDIPVLRSCAMVENADGVWSMEQDEAVKP